MASNNTKCKLDNGSVLAYHLASPLEGKGRPDPCVFSYMGVGVVYAVGRDLQYSNTRLRFYRLRSDRPRWAR